MAGGNSRKTERGAGPAGASEGFVFDRGPVMIYWESTQACDLACVHCRAEAVPGRHPGELTTGEARALFREIATFGGRNPPHLVITGGDPLQRPDLCELIAHARELGLDVSTSPAGTAKLTREAMVRLKEAGVHSISLSLDGSDAARHDAFRGVDGSYEWTIAGARYAREAEVPLQVNTMVTARTLADLPRIHEVVKTFGAMAWSLFFLVSTGRGRELAQITPAEGDAFLAWLWERAARAPFRIRTTEAPHFRRVAFQAMRAEGMSRDAILRTPVGRGFGIRDGNGVAFISHLGEVYPSGFFPLAAGNVRREPLVGIYRDSPLFRSLRDPGRLKGRCGRCAFRAICGGSRARAFAATGDPLETDPLGPHQPGPARAAAA